MSILKKKVRLIQEKKVQKEPQENEPNVKPSPKKVTIKSEPSPGPTKRRKIPGQAITPEKIRCAKNVVRNYGKAIANFACLEIALPYLKTKLEQEGLDYTDFVSYAMEAKRNIENIDSFRNALLIKKEDSATCISCKKVFQFIGEVFIKYFSVNWIYNTKILHKLAYVKYRFRILRRLRNPELFTYLKS